MTRDVRERKGEDGANPGSTLMQSGEYRAVPQPPAMDSDDKRSPKRSTSSGSIPAVVPPAPASSQQNVHAPRAGRPPSSSPTQGGPSTPGARTGQSGYVPTQRRPKTRGKAILMRKRFVSARFGASAVELLEARASAELRNAFSLAEQHDSWVDFGLFIEATELIDRLFGRGDLQIAWDVGRFAAENNIGMWKAMVMRLLRPTTVLNIASSLWSHHYDTGRLSAVPEPDDSGVQMSILDFSWPHRTHCMSIGGWIERTLEFGRPKWIDVKELSCRARGGDQCSFGLHWG